jgi:hypothetical protein
LPRTGRFTCMIAVHMAISGRPHFLITWPLHGLCECPQDTAVGFSLSKWSKTARRKLLYLLWPCLRNQTLSLLPHPTHFKLDSSAVYMQEKFIWRGVLQRIFGNILKLTCSKQLHSSINSIKFWSLQRKRGLTLVFQG